MTTNRAKELAIVISSGVATENDFAEFMGIMQKRCDKYFSRVEIEDGIEMEDFMQEVYLETYQYITEKYHRDIDLGIAFSMILQKVRKRFTKGEEMKDHLESEAVESEEIENIEDRNLLSALGVALKPREYDIISMYYGCYPYTKEYTYDAIGEKYSISRTRVRDITITSMRKLRRKGSVA